MTVVVRLTRCPAKNLPTTVLEPAPLSCALFHSDRRRRVIAASHVWCRVESVHGCRGSGLINAGGTAQTLKIGRSGSVSSWTRESAPSRCSSAIKSADGKSTVLEVLDPATLKSTKNCPSPVYSADRRPASPSCNRYSSTLPSHRRLNSLASRVADSRVVC